MTVPLSCSGVCAYRDAELGVACQSLEAVEVVVKSVSQLPHPELPIAKELPVFSWNCLVQT